MGWLEDAWNATTSAVSDAAEAVGDAAEAVGDAVEDAVNAAADAVSDVVETAGNAVSDGIAWLGGAASGIPVVGGVLEGVAGWIGGVVSSVFDLVAVTVKVAGGILGGLLGGAIKVVGGAITLNGGLILEGLGDIVSPIAGGLLLLLGSIAVIVQSLIPFQSRERPLTASERDLLRRVFHDSVALYNVRIVPGRAGIFDVNSRPFTLGNTIYLKGDVSPETLVHECVHVWQYQHDGPRYASDALAAQWFVGGTTTKVTCNGVQHDFPKAYDWHNDLDGGATRWSQFNNESAAEFIEDVWTCGESVALTPAGVALSGNGAFYDADGVDTGTLFMDQKTDRTPLADAAVAALRGRRALRPSVLLQ